MQLGWTNFYVIIGAAGSTLIGIQFVVITLVGTIRGSETTDESIAAFGTPTVVHLTMGLAIAAIMSVPWPSLVPAAAVLALCGVGAFCYSIVIIRRAHRQTTYEPVDEDWLWYATLPFVTYATLTAGAVALPKFTSAAAFVIAAAALAIIVIGIHNAWDTVTYMVLNRRSD